MTVPSFLPCPFCGVEIVDRETWARSFNPPRLWHEWHHPRNGCRLAGIVEAADETPERQAKAAARWNGSRSADIVKGWTIWHPTKGFDAPHYDGAIVYEDIADDLLDIVGDLNETDGTTTGTGWRIIAVDITPQLDAQRPGGKS